MSIVRMLCFIFDICIFPTRPTRFVIWLNQCFSAYLKVCISKRKYCIIHYLKMSKEAEVEAKNIKCWCFRQSWEFVTIWYRIEWNRWSITCSTSYFQFSVQIMFFYLVYKTVTNSDILLQQTYKKDFVYSFWNFRNSKKCLSLFKWFLRCYATPLSIFYV